VNPHKKNASTIVNKKVRYLLKISYDGTDYEGWQEQPGRQTIAGTLKRAFQTTFNSTGTLIAASRTDTGVHARQQIAVLTTDLCIDCDALKRAWNNKLPHSIVIESIWEVPLGFHPWHNVAYKEYHYYFCVVRPSPFCVRYNWYVQSSVDKGALEACLALFKGRHDFRSFITDARDRNTSIVIDEISAQWNESRDACVIKVRGEKFFQHMIRRIVGACIWVATHSRLSARDVAMVLEQKNPNHHFPKAPASGLHLWAIAYKNYIVE
jgi:tRNA pseudouridine38-40 synthase